MVEETHMSRTTVCTDLLETDQPDDPILQYEVTLNEHGGLLNVLINPNDDDRNENFQSSSDFNCSRTAATAPSGFSNENQTGLITPLSDIPLLTICMLVIGTRGDIQPFINFALYLKKQRHRVRLATHAAHGSLVREYGLQFFPLAGDPAHLMQFVVKNGGIVPQFSPTAPREILDHQRMFMEILNTCWHACIDDDDALEGGAPFRADVIISNPPAYAHIHCAEKLRIPLHILFTMPWTPTNEVPHPFCVPDSRSVIDQDSRFNSLTFTVVDRLTWMGLGGCVNAFRRDTLHLSTLHARQATRALIEERVAHTYCWSEKFIPRPRDWPPFINITGYLFLDGDPLHIRRPPDLIDFLALDEETPPIYIGFGSIDGHQRVLMLKALLEALERTDTRAILHKLAVDEELPATVYKLSGNIDQDWLFQHVAAVCHHGGAGTTAAGLRAGRPTIVIPFFGDQFYNGYKIHHSGAGRYVLPNVRYSVQHLVEAITYVKSSDEARQAARQFQDWLRKEDGCANALQSFYNSLPSVQLHSDLRRTFAARYTIQNTDLKVSLPVAQVLVLTGYLAENQLQPLTTRKWHFAKHGPLCMRRSRRSFRRSSQESDSHTSLESYDKIIRAQNEIYVGCDRLFDTWTARTPAEYAGWYVKNSPPNDNSWTKKDGTKIEGSSMEMASLVSGYSIEICKTIVRDFESSRRLATEATVNYESLSTQRPTMYTITVDENV